MSKLVKNIMAHVIKSRMNAGEQWEDIFTDYPRLTDAEKEELREGTKNRT